MIEVGSISVRKAASEATAGRTVTGTHASCCSDVWSRRGQASDRPAATALGLQGDVEKE